MTITAAQVKSLRQRTGAGMMDCKKTLEETGGDEEKAVEIIQKKGLAKVAKKAGAIAAEGLVHSYIHGGRIGVLVEVNCQTDFVARNEDFQKLVEEVSMHIASAKPEVVREEELSQALVSKQRDLFAGQIEEEAKQTGKSKPADIVEKIIDGKVAAWKKEACLLDQPYIFSEDNKTVGSIIDELSAKIGEKLAIRRFVRFELGEGIEKKTEDFAAEVAAQMASN